MAFKQFELPEVGTITVYKRRGASSIRLSVTATNEVRVTQPTWLAYRAGVDFAASRADWIQQNRTASAVLQQERVVGKTRRLVFEPGSVAKPTAQITKQAITIKLPAAMPLEHEAAQDAAKSAILRALRREADLVLLARLRLLARDHGFEYATSSTRQLKTRWGSCSSDKHITLNIFLLELPWELIDYVIFHELTHTRVMHHGPKFWAELEQLVPEARAMRKRINTYRPYLRDFA